MTHTYFHDAEIVLSDSSILKEKGRLYKNINKDGTFNNYCYEVTYYLGGVKLPGFPVGDKFIEWHFPFTCPKWAHASDEEINRAIVRRSKK